MPLSAFLCVYLRWSAQAVRAQPDGGARCAYGTDRRERESGSWSSTSRRVATAATSSSGRRRSGIPASRTTGGFDTGMFIPESIWSTTATSATSSMTLSCGRVPIPTRSAWHATSRCTWKGTAICWWRGCGRGQPQKRSHPPANQRNKRCSHRCTDPFRPLDATTPNAP